MATTCTRNVDFDALYMEDNVRTPETMLVPEMVKSLKNNGFQSDRPLSVSEKSDGRFLVLRGNRRTTALQWLKDNEPEEFARIVQGGKVPAIIYRGLTVEDEIDLRVDHGTDLDRVGLDDWGIFQAVAQLYSTGNYTQDQIAERLSLVTIGGKNDGKPRRSYVQTRVNLTKLPTFVQDEFRKLTVNKDDTTVRWNMIPSLYASHSKEFLQHINGDGPEFSALWEKCLTPPEVEDDTPKPKALTAADALKRAQTAASEGLRDALLAVTRQSDGNIARIDEKIVDGERAAHILKCIEEYMGSVEFDALQGAALQHYVDKQDSKEDEPAAA